MCIFAVFSLRTICFEGISFVSILFVASRYSVHLIIITFNLLWSLCYICFSDLRNCQYAAGPRPTQDLSVFYICIVHLFVCGPFPTMLNGRKPFPKIQATFYDRFFFFIK